jgi:hypothetical protein
MRGRGYDKRLCERCLADLQLVGFENWFKKEVIGKLHESNTRPSFQKILAGIKERNGSCEAR